MPLPPTLIICTTSQDTRAEVVVIDRRLRRTMDQATDLEDHRITEAKDGLQIPGDFFLFIFRITGHS